MKVKTIYLNSGSTSHEKKGKLESRFPTILDVPGSDQAHYLDNRPIFPVPSNPPIIDTWSQLLHTAPPEPPRLPRKFAMLCEDNNPWPVSTDRDVDMHQRLQQRRETREEVWQNANIHATRAAAGSTLATGTAVIALLIASIITLLIVLLIVQSRFLGDQVSSGSTQTLGLIGLFVLGALATIPPGP